VVTDVPVKRKPGQRGPGKKPALECTSIRLPSYVMNYFNEVYGSKKQKAIREVLMQYVDTQLKGVNDGINANP
jgi:hypothetical protein